MMDGMMEIKPENRTVNSSSVAEYKMYFDMAHFFFCTFSEHFLSRSMLIVWDIFMLLVLIRKAGPGGSVGCASDWRPEGRGFDPCRGLQHSFVEIDHEIFSTVILSLPLIQEGQLSVSGERMCTILVNRLED